MQPRVVLITGASRGIGKSIAQKLFKDGFKLAVTASTKESKEKVQKDLQEQSPFVVQCDIRSKKSIDEAVKKVVAEFGKIDVLVNNAGISGGGHIVDIEDRIWKDVLETNLSGTFRMIQSVLMFGNMPKPGGRIVNIASTGGKQGIVFGSPYCASKHGVVGLTKSIGLELAESGITVNAICPGFVESELAQIVREKYAKIWNVDVSEAKNRIEQRVPIKRYITTSEVAGFCSYIASPEAQGITAQAINVCGGLGNY